MPKTRIAAWIAGGALILSSGVALAETAPDDPSLDNDPAAEVANLAETDLEGQQVVEQKEVVEEAPEVKKGVATEELEEPADDAGDTPKDNHGAVVSQAAKNHDFDEACGNHGAYVSSVAKGGDPAAPACAEETADDSAEDTAGDAAGSEKHGRQTKERPAKPSGGKGKSGK